MPEIINYLKYVAPKLEKIEACKDIAEDAASSTKTYESVKDSLPQVDVDSTENLQEQIVFYPTESPANTE